MSLPIDNNLLMKIVVIVLLTNFSCFLMNIKQAMSAGGEAAQPTTTRTSGVSSTVQNPGTPSATPQTTTTGDSSVSPNLQNVAALSVTPTTLLQTGSNNYANLNPNTGAMKPPRCKQRGIRIKKDEVADIDVISHIPPLVL